MIIYSITYINKHVYDVYEFYNKLYFPRPKLRRIKNNLIRIKKKKKKMNSKQNKHSARFASNTIDSVIISRGIFISFM